MEPMGDGGGIRQDRMAHRASASSTSAYQRFLDCERFRSIAERYPLYAPLSAAALV